MSYDEIDGFDFEPARQDQWEEDAAEVLVRFFDENRDKVFFFRQVELYHEDRFFHWVTNRALHRIIGSVVKTEKRQLSHGTPINFVWHKSLRYYRTELKNTLKLVELYSDPNVGASLGLNAEHLVVEGFATKQFLCLGRHADSYGAKKWIQSDRNLDFIFSKDSVGYGIEVKNQLRYPEYGEIDEKVRMCEYLGIKPVFVVRMMPRDWIFELQQRGGFALILKYQLYPVSHRVIAKRVAKELGLPVDSPRALLDKTMRRFLQWHERNV